MWWWGSTEAVKINPSIFKLHLSCIRSLCEHSSLHIPSSKSNTKVCIHHLQCVTIVGLFLGKWDKVLCTILLKSPKKVCVQWSDQRSAKSSQVDTHTHTHTHNVFFQTRSIYPLTDSSILWILQLTSKGPIKILCKLFFLLKLGRVQLDVKSWICSSGPICVCHIFPHNFDCGMGYVPSSPLLIKMVFPNPLLGSFIFTMYVCVCVSACVCIYLVVSDSLWPHRLSSARFFCPWNFPGKNPGLDCHFFLQRIYPAHRWNLHLFHLLFCRWILYHWSR